MNYPDLLRKIVNEGKVVKPHGQEVCELVKASLIVEPECNIYAWPKARPLEKLTAYMWQELAWYLSGDRQAKNISEHAALWDEIKNPDGTLNSNYGFLVFYNRTWHPSLGRVAMSPFQWAFNCLRDDKDSRQAIITYNTGGFNFKGNRDYICTQHQAFFIRDNVLRCFVAVRSWDMIFGSPYNMPWWSLVHQQLRLELLPYYPDLKLGNIEADIYSAHIYSRHYKIVEKMLEEVPERNLLEVKRKIPLNGPQDLDWYRKNLQTFITIRNG